MRCRPSPSSTLWVLRTAGLLIAALTLIALPAASADASPPPPTNEATTADTTTARPTPVTATVSRPASPHMLAITVEPAAQTVQEGNTATFTADITTPSHTTIRWQTAPALTGPWTDIPVPGGILFTKQATIDLDGHLFRAVASLDQQAASSTPAILHVLPISQPVSNSRPPIPAKGCPILTANGARAPDSPCPSAPPATATPPATSAQTSAAASAPATASGTMNSATQPGYGTAANPVIQVGQEQVVTGHDFTPGARVKVTLTPPGTDLGTYTVGSDGTMTVRFTTSQLMPGIYTVNWTTLQP
jgi:hypothetical protein